MVDTLARNFESQLGPLTPAELPEAVQEKVAELAQIYTTENWLLRPRRRFGADRKVKIAEGVEVVQRVHKAPGGLIRGTVETQHGKIVAAGLSGDFFFYPADKLADLEQALVGTKIVELQHILEEYYHTNAIESPGVTPDDLAVALGAAGAR
jgi:lipoate-protein ligase A